MHQGDSDVLIAAASPPANSNKLPAHHPDSERKITLSELQDLQEALLIGLESFGEIERVIDRFELEQLCGRQPDIELRPLHPTGSPGTLGLFATALRICNSIRRSGMLTS
jgi:hypothetical protein